MALDTFAMEVNLKIGLSYLADVQMTSEKLLAVLKAPSPSVKTKATSLLWPLKPIAYVI